MKKLYFVIILSVYLISLAVATTLTIYDDKYIVKDKDKIIIYEKERTTTLEEMDNLRNNLINSILEFETTKNTFLSFQYETCMINMEMHYLDITLVEKVDKKKFLKDAQEMCLFKAEDDYNYYLTEMNRDLSEIKYELNTANKIK